MDIRVGQITHYYNRLEVAVLKLQAGLEIGQVVHILGRSTDFYQYVSSLEIEHERITRVPAGLEVALKVNDFVRKGDVVYRVITGEGEALPEELVES